MIQQTAEILHTASIWIVVLPFLAGVINYKGLNRDSTWIFALVVVALVPQLLTALAPNKSSWLSVSYNLYTPVEIGILYLVFIPKFGMTTSRRLVQLSALLSVAFYVFLACWFGLNDKFLNWTAAVCNVTYMFWILLLIRQEYNAEETIIAKGNPFTWYLIAYALYAPGRVATLALYPYVHDDNNPWLISLDSLFNILQYLFFTIGLLIRRPALIIL